jgi:putative transposase
MAEYRSVHTSLTTNIKTVRKSPLKIVYKRKKGFPKFKKKYDKNTFTLVGHQYSVRENKLRIANQKSLMKVKWHRELPSKPTSCTIIKDNIGRYYVSFVVEVEPKIVPPY